MFENLKFPLFQTTDVEGELNGMYTYDRFVLFTVFTFTGSRKPPRPQEIKKTRLS
jgi:hypothetical protein